MARSNSAVADTANERDNAEEWVGDPMLAEDRIPDDDPGMQPTAEDMPADGLEGGDLPTDPEAVREFLAASMDEERKALSKLMKYAAKVQPTLTELQVAYEGHRDRTARLYALATRGLARI